MRFVVVGAGAIGGVVGAQLARAGHDVTLVARGAHHDAIRDHGLRLRTADLDVTLQVPVVDHPGRVDFGDDTVVLLATKSHDTPTALAALAEGAPASTPVASLQNGVSNESLIHERFTDVYGVCVMSPTAHLEPGVVIAYSTPVTGLLDTGRYPDGVDDRASAIVDAFCSATFEANAVPDIMRWKYGKLLLNLGNAIEALCGPAARQSDLYRAARDEGAACLRAAGIEFVDSEEDKQRRADRLTVLPIDGAPRGGGSTWQSLYRGAGTVESDHLNGVIVALGAEHGVPTPVNAAVLSLVHQAAASGDPPGSHTVDEIEALR